MNSKFSKMTIEQPFCYSIFILDVLLGRDLISSVTGEDLFRSTIEGLSDFIRKKNIAKSVAENLFNKQMFMKIIMEEFIKLIKEKKGWLNVGFFFNQG